MKTVISLDLLKAGWNWVDRSTFTGSLTLHWSSQESGRSWLSTTPLRCPILLKQLRCPLPLRPHQQQLISAGAWQCAATSVHGAWSAPAQGHRSLQTHWWRIRWQREVTLGPKGQTLITFGSQVLSRPDGGNCCSDLEETCPFCFDEGS